jgi:uncharacterized damage-inducible protein DinB
MKNAAEIANTPDFAVGFTAMMLESMERETETTRRVLAAVPEEKREFRPEPKARTAFELAWHLASSDIQFLEDIADLKFSPEPRYREEPKSMSELVSWYAVHVNMALARVGVMSPEELLTPVDFYGVMTAPVFRFLLIANNHSVHHRAQLANYLRPMGARVPDMGGGSADEPL